MYKSCVVSVQLCCEFTSVLVICSQWFNNKEYLLFTINGVMTLATQPGESTGWYLHVLLGAQGTASRDTEITTGNCSGRARQIMNGEIELADNVRSLETELAEAASLWCDRLERRRAGGSELKWLSTLWCCQKDTGHVESEPVQVELALLHALENPRGEHQVAI